MTCSAKEVLGYWHPNTFCNQSNDCYIKEQTLNTVNSKSKHNIPSLPQRFAVSKINNDVIVELDEQYEGASSF